MPLRVELGGDSDNEMYREVYFVAYQNLLGLPWGEGFTLTAA